MSSLATKTYRVFGVLLSGETAHLETVDLTLHEMNRIKLIISTAYARDEPADFYLGDGVYNARAFAGVQFVVK